MARLIGEGGTMAGTVERPRASRGLAVVAGLGLLAAAAGCGTGSGTGEGSGTASAAPAATAAAPSRAATNPTFTITHNWPDILPADALLIPVKGSVEACSDHPLDRDGRRAEPRVQNPRVVTADGSCNEPLSDPTVGIMQRPTFASEGESVQSGMPLGVECVVTGSDKVRDVRGEVSASTTWLGVLYKSPQTGDVTQGYISEVNTGYVLDEEFRECE